jgi:hypothetical protein
MGILLTPTLMSAINPLALPNGYSEQQLTQAAVGAARQYLYQMHRWGYSLEDVLRPFPIDSHSIATEQQAVLQMAACIYHLHRSADLAIAGGTL